MRTGIVVMAVAALMSTSATAAIQWTDWTSASTASATGTLAGVAVTLAGPIHNWQVSGGTDYWRTGGNPFAAYDALSNLPGNNDFVAPSGVGARTITFSRAVIDPYIAIISLGQPSLQTSWTFDAPFSIIDQGRGFWGNGVFTVVGNTLSAGEAHGVIQFRGSFTSLTLTTNNPEFWSGLTIGASGVVPEPASWAMLIAGFGLVGAAARRRRKSVAA